MNKKEFNKTVGQMVRTLVTVLFILIGSGSFSNLHAQGKTGTIISMDGSNCTVLYVGGITSTYFSYLRHNQAPIQMIDANYPPLSEEGTGLFDKLVNNMLIGTTTNKIEIYNGNDATEGRLYTSYLAIVAPTGYNITRYVLDIDSSLDGKITSSNQVKIEDYTYDINGNIDESSISNILHLTGGSSEKMEATKDGVNIIYFRMTVPTKQLYRLVLNSLEITYVVEDAIQLTIPNASGSTNIHTGIINLGGFKKISEKYAFQSENVTDLEPINYYGENEGDQINMTSQVVDGEGYLVTVSNGTFYMECPQKFRMTNASIKFLSADATVNEYSETLVYTPSAGTYVLGDGNGNYLVNANGVLRNTKNLGEATVWTVELSGSAWRLKSGSYYLARSDNYLVSSLNTDNSSWYYNNGFIQTVGTGSNRKSYRIVYDNGWKIAVATSNYGKLYTRTATTKTYTGGDFTASVFSPDGKSVQTSAPVSSGNPATLDVSGYNNDAIKFSISGLGTNQVGMFQVTLKVDVLDPHVQTIEAASVKEVSGENRIVSAVSVSSKNYMFNDGETIIIPIPSDYKNDDTHQIVFRNAYNENRSEWYTGTPNGTGLSNYYLIDSNYEENGSDTNAPDDKVNIDQIGTVKLEFSNIKDLTTQGGVLTENEFDKSAAAFSTINLANSEEKTVYVYSADHPTYIIMPESKRAYEHIAYRYYEATLKPVLIEEVPEIEVVDETSPDPYGIIVYDSTLKGKNNKKPTITKDFDVDNQHAFFGIKIKAKKEGTPTPKKVESITSGETYKIGNSNGNYLKLSGTTLSNTTDYEEATDWTFTQTSNGYSIKSGNYYLSVSRSGNYYSGFTYSLSLANKSSDWLYNSSGLRDKSYSRYLMNNNNGWSVTGSAQSEQTGGYPYSLSSSSTVGVLTSNQIINSIKTLLTSDTYKDKLYSVDDPFRTILYLDMSGLTTVSDAEGKWDEFYTQTADNCLYFMPKGFNRNVNNVIAGGIDGDGEAVGDIIIKDQQPFYTPYTFKTGTHVVKYERTGTNGKEPTQNTTLVMPFEIPLSSEGCLKTYSNVVNEDVKFYHMTALGEEDKDANVTTKAYKFTSTAVSTGKATANTPYHIVSVKPTEDASYVIELTGATFQPTPDVIKTTKEDLTGYGSYNGVAVDKTEDILYFSKDYFWRSSTLTTSNTVKILPYRAYYTTTQDLSNAAKQISVVFLDEEVEVVPGIATEIEYIMIEHEKRGTGNSDAVYDLSGRKLAGNAQLKKGIYIMNGKKILVK